MAQKILLVGDPRICPQVAYVMDWPNFEQVERLTDAAVNKYLDYKIVICDFKRKSQKYAPLGGGGGVTYLDDICNELDAEATKVEPGDGETVPKLPLWRRIFDRIKERAVLIAILRHYRRQHGPFKSGFWINRLPTAELTLSELFIKVLYSRPCKIKCNALETMCYIHYNGKVIGCWETKIPFGIIGNDELKNVYNSHQARIVRLSSMNKSLCLCDHQRCEYGGRQLAANQSLNTEPVYLELGIDRACNLVCPSCRKEYRGSSNWKNKQNLIEKLDKTGWLDRIPNLRLAGAGEVFCSDTYMNLLVNTMQRDQIQILSNGTLFDVNNWQKLSKYQDVAIMISVDAATAATYRKVRGGDFGQLMENLAMLGELRQQGKIKYFESNYIVQRDNYAEMAEFIRLAKKLHIDRVHFMKLNNWGTFTQREYRDKCLIVRQRRLHRDLRRVLQDPIFQDPIVDLTAFSQYIKNFAQKFPQALQPRSPYEW